MTIIETNCGVCHRAIDIPEDAIRICALCVRKGEQHPHDLIEKGRKYDELKSQVIFYKGELAIKDKKIDELKAKVVALEKAIKTREEAIDSMFIAAAKLDDSLLTPKT